MQQSQGIQNPLSHAECLLTDIIQMAEGGVSPSQFDLSLVPPVLCAPITEQTK